MKQKYDVYKKFKCTRTFNIDRLVFIKGNIYMYCPETNMLKINYNVEIKLTKKESENFKEV